MTIFYDNLFKPPTIFTIDLFLCQVRFTPISNLGIQILNPQSEIRNPKF
jgi:hypothetical protein